MHCFAIKTLFRKIPVELHKPPSPKEKYQLLLHDNGGGCYMNKLSEKLPPLNKRTPCWYVMHNLNKPTFEI